MKYVPRAVMIGYINALAVLIFLAQLPQLTNVPITVYILTLLSLAIIYILPRFTQAIPSPLVALAVMTIAAIASTSSGVSRSRKWYISRRQVQKLSRSPLRCSVRPAIARWKAWL